MAVPDTCHTGRILLLIDLHPLTLIPDPAPFVAAILAAARPLLSAPFLSSSLFAFRFFFSNLSVLTSISKTHALLGRSPVLPFSLPSQTLISLSDTLNSVASQIVNSGTGADVSSAPSASFLALSLSQILYDYLWDPPAHECKGTAPHVITVRSNLVIFFSDFARSLLQLSEFRNAELDGEKEFCDLFSRVFNAVSKGFNRNDIHLCWTNVNIDKEIERICSEQFDVGLSYLEKGIKGMDWGISSTDAISIGSAVVPLGLTYPQIATSIGCKAESCRAELILEILDVGEKPLACRFCDLELLGYLRAANGKFFLGQDSKKIYVKEIKKNDPAKLKDISTSDLFLLRGFSENKVSKQGDSTFVVDKILEMLQTERTEYATGKPAWQLLLNFLFREGYSAKVFISDAEGTSITGILMPFSIHSAVLCTLRDESTVDQEIEAKQYMNSSNVLKLLQFVRHSYANTLELNMGEKKRRKDKNEQISHMAWSSFYESILNCSPERSNYHVELKLNLEEVYFPSGLKKIRFLECWMKQIKRSHALNEIQLEAQINITGDEVQEVVVSNNASEFSSSASSLSGEKGSSGPKDDLKPSFFFGETSEEFYSTIAEKIQMVIDSEKLDLGLFAECLVDSSINWLYVKCTNTERSEGDYYSEIATELTKSLLRKPRDLMSKYKDSNSTACKVREHEMQILFRMEMLYSKVGAFVDEATREKMLKDICSLLANIEFNLEGGVFGGESLVKFAGRTIRNRYSQSLSDVIRKIYDKMEFAWTSDEEDEDASLSLHNSTDNVKERAASDERVGEEERRLIEALEKRKKACKLDKSTTWQPNFNRVWVPKQKARTKPRVEGGGRKEGRRQRRRSNGGVVVCETPMLVTKQAVESGGSHNKDANCRVDNGSACKALFKDS